MMGILSASQLRRTVGEKNTALIFEESYIMGKYKYRIKDVCVSIARIYLLLNALQLKVFFHATYELCMYI